MTNIDLKKNNHKTNIDVGIQKIEVLSKHLRDHTRRNLNTSHINYKIHYLLYDSFTFVNAYAKISKNKGALTEGIEDENIIQLFGLKTASSLAKKIQQDSYEFKPVRRTWIPKPGKNPKRPIDVPNQSDRIVQEAVREILEAIYEPVFAEFQEKTNNLCSNYGFRPKKSCWSAIKKLELHSRRCNVVIEGDIVSAYNNVNHDILLQILQRRIRDKKFLKLIEKMLKSGIMDEGKFEHSLNGTPQGGIVSPLLFNIYMFELDQFIYENCIIPIQKENSIQKKKPEVRSRKYNQINYKTEKARKEYVKFRDKYRTHGGNVNKTLAIQTKKTFKNLLKERHITPYNEISKLEKGAIFVRYADDWVLAMTCSKKEALATKEKIKNYLKDQLKMNLDEQKTSITPVSKGYKFLGFEIRIEQTKPKITKVLQKTSAGIFQRVYRRTTSRLITIEPDSDRILKRFRLLKMCNKENFPMGKPNWTSYNEFQIVQKYAQIMRGIFNYYKPCGRLSRLYHISYILQYSCAKTIAMRKKVSLPQVFKTYGLNLTVKNTIQGTKNERIATQQFYDIIKLRQMKKSKPAENFITPVETDPFRIREHWRTKFKVYNECCICGATKNIQLHHINSIASLKKKKDNAAAIRSQINRLQIPVCHSCHKDITHGKYSNSKKPIEFYNEFLAKL